MQGLSDLWKEIKGNWYFLQNLKTVFGDITKNIFNKHPWHLTWDNRKGYRYLNKKLRLN